MAILNNILKGQLKGRIGNTWFAHAKSQNGRPLTRAGSINESPNNPKSYKQMEQRARFANSVKFYQRATQNFFKFAYEDKKANESDYNAFMRHNIERSLVLPKDRVDATMFPALGNRWMLSQGSLDVYLPFELTYEADKSTEINTGLDGETVGEASQVLISRKGAKVGDIVTIVVITAYVTRENASSLDDVESAPIWTLYQFIVNPKDNTPWDEVQGLNTHYVDLLYNKDQDSAVISGIGSNYSAWATIIVTRKVGTSLKATTSYLLANVNAMQLEAIYKGADNINNAVTSWGAENQAILKGGIATRTIDSGSNDPVTATTIASVDGKTPPADITIFNNGNKPLKIEGSNLPNTTPTSSDTTILTIQDFELNDARTEASCNIVGMRKDGNVSVSYGGKSIANVTCIDPDQAHTDA